jgi:hypothetical protein
MLLNLKPGEVVDQFIGDLMSCAPNVGDHAGRLAKEYFLRVYGSRNTWVEEAVYELEAIELQVLEVEAGKARDAWRKKLIQQWFEKWKKEKTER